MSERANRKELKQELKQPDAFQKVGGEASTWLIHQQKLVIIGVVAVLLVGAAIGVVSYLGGRGEERASSELGAALAVLGRPVTDQVEKNPDPLAGPTYKTAKEKDEALIKALSELRSAHPGTRAAVTAALPLGEAQLRQGQADEALASLGDYLKDSPADEPLRPTALEGRGYAYEAKGNLNEALAAFEQLSRENKTDFLNGMGLYHRARILELQGKKEEAAKQFSEIPSAATNTSAARLATERMAVLASQGVKVPPPVPSSAPDAG